jgi:hypothetical protein
MTTDEILSLPPTTPLELVTENGDRVECLASLAQSYFDAAEHAADERIPADGAWYEIA